LFSVYTLDIYYYISLKLYICVNDLRSAFGIFVEIKARKAILFLSVECDRIYECAMKPYDVFTVKNALVKRVCVSWFTGRVILVVIIIIIIFFGVLKSCLLGPNPPKRPVTIPKETGK
jgi:hypothetical protein